MPKPKRQYIEILQYLSGKNVYDSTLLSCFCRYRIDYLGRVVGVKRDLSEYDLLPIFPTVKILNKMVELIIKNAMLSIAGVWQADDDGVISLKDISIIPGAVIPKAVGSSGIQSIAPSYKFNLTWEMVESLQKQVKSYFNEDGERKDV